MSARGIELSLDDFDEMFRSDKTPEEQERERYTAIRALIRESLEEINNWPPQLRMLDERGEISIRESRHADITINVHSTGRGQGLLADYGSYRASPADLRGLVIHISPMMRLVFDEAWEDGSYKPFAHIERWNGLRGPLVFELRDLE